MIKYKAKTKDCSLTVRVKLPSGSLLNEREFDFFGRKMLRGFFKPQKLKRNVILYTGPIGISLYERLQKPISKYDFYFIIEQIADATLKLQKNGFPWNKVVWDIHNTYINETTKELLLIYLPLENGVAGTDVLGFIENVIYSARPADEFDPDFISRFVYFIKAMSGYDPNKIESYIIHEDRNVVNIIKRHTSGGSGFMTDKPKDYYEHYAKEAISKGKDKDALFDNADEPTGLLSEDEPTRLLNEEEDEPTGLLTESEDTALLSDDEATGLLVESEDERTIAIPADVHYPTLYRVLTDEKISINKPVFRLGKEKSYVDYFVTNNIVVSRGHADIITRGDKYYVKDLNSKNRTYINNAALPAQVEVEIHNGDQLKLGNEEFIFYI